ncbi:uncharacterized protein CTRU02_204860 [Colletotrichum truncatum]|uniref:Uncharacterized protein n=1 Tax=Colletotrichum truncatum TaxID=5467 RepID=A0ACC3ZDV7_COLTU|nr:uncharacterized protein CTRU02_03094 [Colletotrichum truncatum]KAF6798052.1 hypothetical protein CTRU02_03094 [Colletotrichum truncatum]
MSCPNNCDALPSGTKRIQKWTFTETPDTIKRHMPIVDGKYHDPDTWEVKEIAPGQQCIAGPPVIDQYWHNLIAGPHDQFKALRASFCKDTTEFLIRLGEFLKLEQCKIHSVNAAEFSVTVIIETTRKRHEITDAMIASRLLNTFD